MLSWGLSKYIETIQQTFVGLQDVFSVTIFRLPTRLEDVLKTSRITSWRRLGWRKTVTMKTYWRRLEDMSWRRLEYMSWRRLEDMSWKHLQDVLETKKKWGYLYLTNLNVCFSNKSIFHKSISGDSKVNPKSLIRTQ